MEYYWELKTYDGQTIEIKPGSVDVVRRRLANGEPINTASVTIPAKQVQSFNKTDKRYTDQALIDSAAQAFREPQIKETGHIEAVWVKKLVTHDKYNRYYSASPGYKKLGEVSGMVEVAFQLPVHLVDTSKVSYCTAQDEQLLT